MVTKHKESVNHGFLPCTTRLYVKLNPDEVQLEDGFTRDVRNIGHYGTGDLEITIRTEEDLTKAEPLILRSYEGS